MILRNGKRIDGCSDTVPIGSLNPFLGATAPYGYLICEGQLVSKATYPELYAICGDTYGTATATEFYLPDLRGRTIVGYKEGDTNFGTLGGLVGSVTSATGNHTLTIDEMPKHTHTQNQWIFNGSSASGTHYGYGWQSNTGSMYNGMPSDWSSNGQTGGGGAHNHGSVSTIQPSINLNWVVKAFMLMPNQSYVANTTQESSVNTYSCDYINNLVSNNDIMCIVGATNNITINAGTNIIVDDLAAIKDPSHMLNNDYIVIPKTGTYLIGYSLRMFDIQGQSSDVYAILRSDISQLYRLCASWQTQLGRLNLHQTAIVPLTAGEKLYLYVSSQTADTGVYGSNDIEGNGTYIFCKYLGD